MAAVLASARAGAEPAAGALTWEAPASCPAAADVEARIAARLEGASRPVKVRVVEAPEGVRVELSMDGADRSFVAPTCEEAATAVAVIVALAARLAEPAPPAPPAVPVAPPALVAPPREAPSAPPAAVPTSRWSVSLATAVDAASLPRATPGVALGVQLGRGLFRFGVTTSGFLPRTEHAAGPPQVQTTVALVDALITGCALVPVLRRLEVGGCVGGGLGLLHGQSASILEAQRSAGLDPAVEAGLFARLVQGDAQLEGVNVALREAARLGLRGELVQHRPEARVVVEQRLGLLRLGVGELRDVQLFTADVRAQDVREGLEARRDLARPRLIERLEEGVEGLVDPRVLDETRVHVFAHGNEDLTRDTPRQGLVDWSPCTTPKGPRSSS